MNTPGGFYLYKTLLDAAERTGAGEELLLVGDTVGGLEMVAIQLSGTFTATVTFEATVDGVNWVAVRFTPLATGTAATTATAAGIYQANLKGCWKVRCNVTAYTDGAVTAKGRTVA